MDTQQIGKLVAAAQRGDTAAFAKLTQAQYRLVYTLAYSTVGDWSAAQDSIDGEILDMGNLRFCTAEADVNVER